MSARVVARKSPAAKPSPEAVIADRKVKPTMPDHTTAPVTVNRFEGVLDGTPAAAARFVERVLALPHVEGPVELPSGRMVATYDPEYLDWFFATAWGTTKKAAAWLGVPEQLFLIACNVAAAGFHTHLAGACAGGGTARTGPRSVDGNASIGALRSRSVGQEGDGR